MALVTTISEVFGVLAAVTVLLWFSAYIETRQLGPVGGQVEDPAPAPVPQDEPTPGPALVVADGPVVVAADAMSPAA